MNEPWQNLTFPWWPSPVGADPRFPAVPVQPIDEPWHLPSSATLEQASWMPPTPISPDPPQGGLLSLLGAGTSGGLFPRLAAPAEHLDSARHWRFASAPPSMGVSLTSAGDNLSPTPRGTDWTAVPPRIDTRSVWPLSEPPSQLPSSAPGGDSERGQGADRGGEVPSAPEILSDAIPYNSWIPGADYAGDGHHHNPRGVYRKFALPPETLRVFDKGTTGPLPFYDWHKYDEPHRLYNDAVKELMDRFMKEHGIKAEQMTPEHARAVLKAIADSDDPRIRSYRAMLQLMGRLYRLRSGARGNE